LPERGLRIDGGNSDAVSGNAHNHAEWSDDLLHWWKRHADLEQRERQPVVQRSDPSRWPNEPDLRRNGERQLQRSRHNEWLLERAVCIYDGDRQSNPGDTDNHAEWSDDLLHWWKRHADLEQRER
jgi:hypothetical protein